MNASVCSCVASYLTLLRSVCERGQDNTFLALETMSKIRKEKGLNGRAVNSETFAFLTCALWLADRCLAHASAVWRLAPGALEESAECW